MCFSIGKYASHYTYVTNFGQLHVRKVVGFGTYLKKQKSANIKHFSSKSSVEGRMDSERAGTLDGKLWVDCLFNKCLRDKISPISEIKLWNGKSCVINNPEFTMANRYLGTHLSRCLIKVDEAILKAPDHRFKPVLVTLRGVGCGKTRLLEEIRIAKNKLSNTIALSITFNNRMDYFPPEENFTPIVSFNFVLSVLIRYVTVVYQLDFQSVRSLINEQLSNLKHPSNFEDIVLFTRSFLQQLLSDLESEMALVNEDMNIVFIIDEIMTMQDDMIAYRKDVAETKEAFRATMSIMHKAFLNERFSCLLSGQSRINVALVISSLDVSAIQIPDSKRLIITLPYDEELDSREIVADWWTKGLKNISDVDRFRLELASKVV